MTTEHKPHIRDMTLADVLNVQAIEAAAHESPWGEKLIIECLQAGFKGLMLDIEDKPIAYVLLSIKEETAHILNFAVLPEAQGKGYGKFLLQHLLNELDQRQDVARIYLEVSQKNQAAINLYLKFNFKFMGARKDYYDLPDNAHEDAIMMVRH